MSGLRALFRRGRAAAQNWLTRRLIRRLLRRAERLCRYDPPTPRFPGEGSRRAAYVRADFWNRECRAGGSIGHSVHLIRAMQKAGLDITVCTGIPFADLEPSIPQRLLPGQPPKRWQNQPQELQLLAANGFLRREIAAAVSSATLVYERPAMGNLLAAEAARRAGTPYVLEYNGSDVWICRHWGNTVLRHEAVFQAIEDAQLKAASLIVVVSAVLRDLLVGRGVPPEKILVNPNGVDPDIFAPQRLRRAGEAVRARLGIPVPAIVLGFIGTFGAWHGIEVLTAAIPKLLAVDERIQLLLIGTGTEHSKVLARVQELNASQRVHLPGMVEQAEAPRYLAACDLYLSPHQTPATDDVPFFGSPTKLFEYMAMARPIVASRLGQIAEVASPALTAAEVAGAAADTAATAVIVAPGNEDELVKAVKELVARKDLWPSLGDNARRRVLENYTWEQHCRRLLARMS